MTALTETPAGRSFLRTWAGLSAALVEAERRYRKDERFLAAMRERPLTRPEARVEMDDE